MRCQKLVVQITGRAVLSSVCMDDLSDLFWFGVCYRVGKHSDILPEARCSDHGSHCALECVQRAVL